MCESVKLLLEGLNDLGWIRGCFGCGLVALNCVRLGDALNGVFVLFDAPLWWLGWWLKANARLGLLFK